MLRFLRQTVSCYLLLMVLTGLVYPLGITAVAQLAFPRRANGSILLVGGRPIGSTLIGQPFVGQRYFWPRPSATTPVAYNSAASSGSNLGPLNPALLGRIERQVELLRQTQADRHGPIPVDLLTASASGLDPHISPAAAEYQVTRIARARQLDEKRIRELVAKYTEGRQLGLLGEPRVNVLLLNLALDGLASE